MEDLLGDLVICQGFVSGVPLRRLYEGTWWTWVLIVWLWISVDVWLFLIVRSPEAKVVGGVRSEVVFALP